jgi:hypothetical protein
MGFDLFDDGGSIPIESNSNPIESAKYTDTKFSVEKLKGNLYEDVYTFGNYLPSNNGFEVELETRILKQIKVKFPSVQ